jgi:hypothetical protein
MSEDAVSHTGFFILCASGDFPEQAYYNILYQWMHVLAKQGVPKAHVFAWARNIDGVTLLHPKPSLTDDPLDTPEGWEDRLVTGSDFEQGQRQLFDTLAVWGQDESVRRLVVIVLGTGQSMSVFSGNGELDPAAFASIQSICGNKPLLSVLDFEDSAIFAASAAARTEGEVFYLLSGRWSTRKTAIVLCDSDGKLADAPGSAKIRYAIYSTMFHRSLFQLVVFTRRNPKLTEITEFLNGPDPGSQGFLSESMSCGCDEMHLRDFFGDPVEPNALLGILVPRPSGGFIDDVDYFVEAPRESEQTCGPLLNTFIRVEFDALGHVLVAAHGQFRWINPVHQAVQRHIRLGPSLPPLPRRFSPMAVLEKAADLLLAARKMDQRGGQSRDELRPFPLASCADSLVMTDEDEKKWTRILQFLQRENGLPPEKLWELDEFSSSLHLSDLEGWCRAIRAAQEALCKEVPRDRTRRAAEI